MHHHRTDANGKTCLFYYGGWYIVVSRNRKLYQRPRCRSHSCRLTLYEYYCFTGSQDSVYSNSVPASSIDINIIHWYIHSKFLFTSYIRNKLRCISSYPRYFSIIRNYSPAYFKLWRISRISGASQIVVAVLLIFSTKSFASN